MDRFNILSNLFLIKTPGVFNQQFRRNIRLKRRDRFSRSKKNEGGGKGNAEYRIRNKEF